MNESGSDIKLQNLSHVQKNRMIVLVHLQVDPAILYSNNQNRILPLPIKIVQILSWWKKEKGIERADWVINTNVYEDSPACLLLFFYSVLNLSLFEDFRFFAILIIFCGCASVPSISKLFNPNFSLKNSYLIL